MAITKITKTELLELTSTTGAVRLPSGTTAERPSTNLNAGDFRFNTDDNKLEYYDGSSWFQISDENLPPIPSENFNTVLWSGNDASQAITGVGFQPDFVWIKRRSSSEPHALYDSVRGINEQLESNSSAQQATNTAPYEGFTSFDSDGFTVGNNGATNRVPNTYVGWSFKGGGAPTATNSASTGAMDANSVSLDGDLQSAYTPSGSPDIYPQKMSINTKAGFSIVSYLTNGNNSARVPHGLGVTPKVVLIKKYNSSGSWHFMTTAIDGSFDDLILDSTNGASNSSLTAPNNDTFAAESGTTSVGHICYSFCDVDGYQKIGSYIGNGSANGPIVEIGFEPAFLLIKQTNTSGNNWVIYDNKRDPINARYKYLSPNNTDAEGSDNLPNYPIVNFLTNGFQIAGTDGRVNTSSGTYIYLAIAADEDTTTPTLANSFKTNLYTGTGGAQLTIGGHLNGAAQFNGTSSRIQLSGAPFGDNNTIKCISGWFSLSGDTNTSDHPCHIYSVSTSGSPIPWFHITVWTASYNYIACTRRQSTGNEATAKGYFTPGTLLEGWHHVAVQLGSTEIEIYLDGRKLPTDDSLTGNATNTSWIDYGNYSGTIVCQIGKSRENTPKYFKGSIDQVRFYDAALTSSQITELYNETTATANTLDFPTGAGCIAAYPLDTNSNDAGGNYNGTDSNITYSNGPGFKPTFVWVKPRTDTDNNLLTDQLRGIDATLYSNSTSAARLGPLAGNSSASTSGITAFVNDGFKIGSWNNINQSSIDYVSWSWKGAVNVPTINTDGSITSIVSSNPASGFSTVKWIGTQTNDSIGHGLSSAPELIIVKDASNIYNWYVFSKPSGASNNLRFEGLNTTSAATTQNSQFTTTSSLIENLTTFASLNTSGATMIAYCFHSVSNYSKVGFYTGNGSSKIVYTTDDGTSGGNNPFQPTWVIIKNTANGYSWIITDSTRGNTEILYANLQDQEGTTSTGITSFNSDGFTVGSAASFNNNGDTFLYLAIKE